MVNQALEVNTYAVSGYAQDAGDSITTHGSDWYWAVTAVMGAATFIFIGLSVTKPRTERLFHYITAAHHYGCLYCLLLHGI
ncbi:hypothetical protein MRB53_041227 [Persea americana]|nr:hypothetical protein MRB53_041227 [Persea americana]